MCVCSTYSPVTYRKPKKKDMNELLKNGAGSVGTKNKGGREVLPRKLADLDN